MIPSSNERSGGASASAITTGERRVVRDVYIPRERARAGETFSSLSQLWYNDTNYAAALTAYDEEEGFVEKDQPDANGWVAKPNREILDQRYPQLIRRLTPAATTSVVRSCRRRIQATPTPVTQLRRAPALTT